MNEDLLALTTVELTTAGEKQNPSYRVVASGEIDLNTAPRLGAALEALIDQGATLVVLDATEVRFLDSSGLSVIIRVGNRLTAVGGRLLIEGMSGAVQRVLELSGMIERYRA